MPILVGCAREEAGEQQEGNPVVKINVVCSDSQTKDLIPGEPTYNENLIDWVDFYFFPGGNTSQAATYYIHKESGKQGSDSFLFDMTSDVVNTNLFPSFPTQVNTVLVFALVNCPAAKVAELGESPTLDEIYDVSVTSDFTDALPMSHFIMSGSATLTKQNQVVVASGTVEVSRYACKLTVGVKVASSVQIPDSSGERVATWEPMLGGMEIYLVDGSKTVQLSGEASTPDYFNYRNASRRFIDQTTELPIEQHGDYLFTEPMYMYPQHWTYGSTQGTDKEPYLKLVLPWMRLNSGGYNSTQKQYYYKIMIPEDVRSEYKCSFVRNNWYHINVDVSILGSDKDEANVSILDGLCYVAYWQDKDVVIKQAIVGNSRYLSVDKDEYTLNNLNEVEMDYTTSHPVELVEESITVTKPYYGTKGASSSEVGGTIRENASGKYIEYSLAQRKALNNGTDWLTNSGTSIVYRHKLINDINNAYFDYSPYYVSFTIRHLDRPDDERYMRTITLTQYPGIYIESTHNPDVEQNNAHWGYVYVNGEQFLKSQCDNEAKTKGEVWKYQNNWRVVHYSKGGRDMFTINVTVLPSDSDLVIGDPRTNDPVDLDYEFNTFVDVDGVQRSLENYYPTDSSTSRTVNMISPSFRISTKYSGIEYLGLAYNYAVRRCAAIQENGFPCGRWRLPTMGEIQFIATLSAKGVFEEQFSANLPGYWAADGRAIVVSNGKVTVVKDEDLTRDAEGNPKALMRCVYDNWYWGNDQVPVDQPTWGDAP
ncbi:MAG: hypothetical protein VZQ48_01435 [Candidatus Cryptobacteroides sp.]|nr:hypothetical protein [Candidatus Cryptobacteroides sp.]